mmetsp:Transcript_12187/g.13973  ORF Transcript_12187/g.13973 Transcript_12187/m.13973 type:complete len:327 (-) Transcript_12187:233-1213(-)
MMKVVLFLLLLYRLMKLCTAWGSNIYTLHVDNGADIQSQSRVLVTGAAGRTGRLVFEKLKKDIYFEPIALVRTERSARNLIKSCDLCGLEHVFVCDVVKDLNFDEPPEELEGIDSMIICTSAVPILSKRSLFSALLKIPVNLIRRRKLVDFRSLRFKFKEKQNPEQIDFGGQVAQINLAKRLKMKKVVIVSSMGVTDPSHFLNSVGKNFDGSGNGDILLWKRKAEKYLIDSGLSYTIIHPGILTDGEPGLEEILIDVDDKLIEYGDRSIARADVSSLCVAALTVGKEKNVSFDCISSNFDNSFSPKSAEEVLTDFLLSGKTANYTL